MTESLELRIGRMVVHVKAQLALHGATGRQASRKIDERLDTVAAQIRLPLPSDRSCNQTPLKDRWIVAPESYLTEEDPRYASQEECLLIKAKLLAEACEFQGMQRPDASTIAAAEGFLGRTFQPESAQCFQSGEPLTLAGLVTSASMATYQLGSGELSVEYRTALNAGGQHVASNVGWIRPDKEIVLLRSLLEHHNVPDPILNKVQLKTYSTDKQTMPPHFSNRDFRWATWVDSPQFATRSDCRGVELQLLSQMFEFVGAPRLTPEQQAAVEQHLRRSLVIDGGKCPITGQPIIYERFVEAARNPRAGRSEYHVGHLYPLTRGGKHDWTNVVWMSDAGNRIQGNDTFDEIVTLMKQAADYHRALEQHRTELPVSPA